MDPRVERLAEILVGYSVDVTSGDVVMISADPDGLALVQEVYRKVLQRGGGYPRLKMSVPGQRGSTMRKPLTSSSGHCCQLSWQSTKLQIA